MKEPEQDAPLIRQVASDVGNNIASPLAARLLYAYAGSVEAAQNRPRITVLCGSTRFADEFARQNLRLTLEGRIVLSIGANVSDASLGITQDSGTKERLDELHLRKIDLADDVLILNVGGYMGASTLRERRYASKKNKSVEHLELLKYGVTP